MRTNWMQKCGQLIVPVLLPAMIFGSVGCSGAPQGDEGSATHGPAAKTTLDGEAIFRGAVFADGAGAALFVGSRDALAATNASMDPAKLAAEVGRAIDQLKTTGNADAVAKLTRAREQLTDGTISEKDLRDALATVDPTLASRSLADRFVERIKATDPTFFDRFEKEMYSGDHLRVRAALEEAGKKIVELGANDAELVKDVPSSMARSCVVIISIVVVAVAIYLAIVAIPRVLDGTGNALLRDEAVERIVEQLPARP